ncbi:MAG: Endoglucanase precursor [Labilithrix sp.]|nr:Endoglucanase precursor [Labilithrix sp.]
MRRALATGTVTWFASGALALAAVACTRKDTPAADAPSGPNLVAPAAAAAAAGPVVHPVAAPEKVSPRFVGRWVPEGTGMRSSWSGSYVVGRFKGTGVSARIKDEGFNLFQVVIDGEPKKVLRTDKAKGEALYQLADGLPDAIHEVSLHRRTEAKVGEVVFYGFEPNGKAMPPPPAPERRIETIGDSISTGYGNEGPGAACGYVNSEQNEFATYSAIAARNLGADHTTIAWSGKTLHEMRDYFDKSLPQRPDSPLWDFAQYQPQVVVVNVGTNNFANVDPGEARFVRLYHELIHSVRAAYPKAFIVCALGSMLSNVYPEGRNNLTQARKYMKTAVTKLREGGDTNLDFLEFPEQNHADGLGCGFHPSLKTHKLMGERLTTFIKEHMGW